MRRLHFILAVVVTVAVVLNCYHFATHFKRTAEIIDKNFTPEFSFSLKSMLILPNCVLVPLVLIFYWLTIGWQIRSARRSQIDIKTSLITKDSPSDGSNSSS